MMISSLSTDAVTAVPGVRVPDTCKSYHNDDDHDDVVGVGFVASHLVESIIITIRWPLHVVLVHVNNTALV